jgi:hypothetical protein
MFAEKSADIRRIDSKIIYMISAWISDLFCENLREPFSLSNLKFLLMPIGGDLAVKFFVSIYQITKCPSIPEHENRVRLGITIKGKNRNFAPKLNDGKNTCY